jgi:hypothetical protein
MKIIGNGFLSIQGQVEAKRLSTILTPLLDIVEEAINLCHSGLSSVLIFSQVTEVEKQRAISCVMLARLLEISESMVMLSKAGFSVEVMASMRNFLDAYFIFGNVCKNPSFIPQYFNTDLKAREKLIKVADKHKEALFEQIKNYASDEVRDELKAKIDSVNASEFNSYEYAKNVGCVAIYDSIYRISSAATHSTPRSLAAYVKENENGEIVELYRGPQLDDIPASLYNVGTFLLTVRSAFDELFDIESTGEIMRLRSKFDSAIIIE